jgi:hypothetical protein
MLNILLVTHYGSDSGGIGTSALALAVKLKKLGHNVFFALTDEYSGYKNYIFRRFIFIKGAIKNYARE